MNTQTDNTVTDPRREELVAAFRAAAEEHHKHRLAAKAHAEAVFGDLRGSGLLVRVDDPERITVAAPRPDGKNDYWYCVELRYDRDFCFEGKAPRVLKMSVGGHGSCGLENAAQLKMYVAAGTIAAGLKQLEELLGQFDWAAFDATLNAMWDAQHKLDRYDSELAAAERERKREKARASIKAGVEFTQGRQSYKYRITKVCPKTVYYCFVRDDNSDGVGYQAKIEQAVESLLDGIWKLVSAA